MGDVTVPEEKHDTSTEGITESLNVGPCMSKDIRVKEGAEYQTMVQMHQRQLEMEALSTQAKATTETGAVSPATTATQSPGEDNMVVTAFEVSGSIDYNKLIDKFGSKPLTPYLLKRLENVTVKQGTVPRLHRFLRREIFFSHRDIEKICELLEGWYGVDPPKEDSQGMAGTSGGVEKKRGEVASDACDALSDLPVHWSRAIFRGDASRPPCALPLHGMAAEGLPMSPSDSDDRRREVPLQRRVSWRCRWRWLRPRTGSHWRRP